jgi:NhaP-type Na+/H+ or K+/H+ antiporter
MFVSRLHVPIICNIANFGRKKEKKYTWKQQIFIWYTNMRGGICFILALDLEHNAHYRHIFRQMVLSSVLVMVMVSVLVLGVGCHNILKYFDLMIDPDKIQLDLEDVEEKGGKWRAFNDK